MKRTRPYGNVTASRKAMTIIEVAMVVVILTVAMPPLLRAFADSAIQSIRPNRATTASFLAAERMEQIVARRFRSTAGYADVSTANFPNETPVTGFTGFNRSVTVTEVGANLAPVGTPAGYKKVRVTVTWNSGADQIVIERVFADF